MSLALLLEWGSSRNEIVFMRLLLVVFPIRSIQPRLINSYIHASRYVHIFLASTRLSP
jgi:hypothetical protein